jgi:flagellar hook-associated protein 3 FlgL
MRVTTRMIFEKSLGNLTRSWNDIGRLQSQIGTGRRIQQPSDDPIGTTRAISARSGLRANEQFQRTIQETELLVHTTEAAVLRMADLAAEVQTIAVQLADDATGESGAMALEQKLDQVLEEMLSLGNTEYSGIRIFGGHTTDQNPFEAVRDAGGKITSFTTSARGPEEKLERLVGRDVLLTINLNGSDLFGEGLSFVDHVIELRDAARAYDTKMARGLTSQIEAAGDRVNLALAITGGLITRIDNLRTQLSAEALQLESSRSAHEDLDMARATLDLQIEQTILQAARRATTETLNLSLVNFM